MKRLLLALLVLVLPLPALAATGPLSATVASADPRATAGSDPHVAVLLADDAAVQALNAQFRGKDAPTNVLSFPMTQADLIDTVTQNSDDGEVLLGDIVLAHGVCSREAAEKGVAIDAHATHLIVHGVLHLLGHDHMDEHEAQAMEAIEVDALATLGLPDPYLIRED